MVSSILKLDEYLNNVVVYDLRLSGFDDNLSSIKNYFNIHVNSKHMMGLSLRSGRYQNIWQYLASDQIDFIITF